MRDQVTQTTSIELLPLLTTPPGPSYISTHYMQYCPYTDPKSNSTSMVTPFSPPLTPWLLWAPFLCHKFVQQCIILPMWVLSFSLDFFLCSPFLTRFDSPFTIQSNQFSGIIWLPMHIFYFLFKSQNLRHIQVIPHVVPHTGCLKIKRKENHGANVCSMMTSFLKL